MIVVTRFLPEGYPFEMSTSMFFDAQGAADFQAARGAYAYSEDGRGILDDWDESWDEENPERDWRQDLPGNEVGNACDLHACWCGKGAACAWFEESEKMR